MTIFHKPNTKPPRRIHKGSSGNRGKAVASSGFYKTVNGRRVKFALAEIMSDIALKQHGLSHTEYFGGDPSRVHHHKHEIVELLRQMCPWHKDAYEQATGSRLSQAEWVRHIDNRAYQMWDNPTDRAEARSKNRRAVKPSSEHPLIWDAEGYAKFCFEYPCGHRVPWVVDGKELLT